MSMSSYTNGTPGGPPSGGPPSGGPPTGGPPAGGNPTPPPMAGMNKAGIQIPDMLIDYNERFKNADPTLYRDGVIHQTMGALISKTKPNPLLKGFAGVGKTRVAEDIARRIANKDATVPPQLRESTIYELPISNLLAGAGIVGELEQRLVGLIEFASDKDNDAILFIDEIHMLLSKTDSSYNKIAQILKPSLARGDIRLIGATTSQEARAFDDDPAFSRRFQHLLVDELTREQTVEILRMARGSYSRHYKHKTFVTDDMLPTLAAIADENSRNSSHRPDNALTLMDRAMADAVINHHKAVATATANNDTNMLIMLNAITTINLQESNLKRVARQLMTGLAEKNVYNEADILNGLARIKGQDSITSELLDALRRTQLEVFPRRKPLSWLMCGPSGVGKTEVSKIVAETLTGLPPIILNMTEYGDKMSTTKLLGSPPGYVGSDSNKELPFDPLETNPHQLIIIDELEKAHIDVQRLFMSIFDEGTIRTAAGKTIDFSKAIVVATTNAGRDAITKPSTGFAISGPQGANATKEALIRDLKNFFEPELVGRFSKVIGFNPLNQEVFREIIVDVYSRQRERIIGEHPGFANALPLALPATTLNDIATNEYNPALGARPAEAAVRAWIEDQLIAAQQQQIQAQAQAKAAWTSGASASSTNAAQDDDDNSSETDDA